MAFRTAVSVLQLLFPFLVILLIASGRVNGQETCQTSGYSPLTVDADDCVEYLISLGNTQCCQTDCSSAGACTTMSTMGTAASAICGSCGQCVPCQQAGIYLAYLISQCNSNGQVGGYIYGFIDPSVNVNVFHS